MGKRGPKPKPRPRCTCGQEISRRAAHCIKCRIRVICGPEPDRETDARMVALWQEGMTQRAIAAKYGVTFQRVSQRIARAMKQVGA